MRNLDSIIVIAKPNEDVGTMKVVESIFAYGNKRNIYVSRDMPRYNDDSILIISVGGDGTMLGAMRASLDYPSASVLGFNTGTLGFLSEELPASIADYIDNILFNGAVKPEARMLLQASIFIDGKEHEDGKDFVAINEFVFTSRSLNAAVITDTYINDQFVSKQLGNGALVSTATGSTAMSLSSGGVIVSPSTNTMQIVPILPHTLTARPIITDGNDVIKISTQFTDRVPEIEIHGDGKVLCSISDLNGSDVEIAITKHPKTVTVWRPVDWNFFNVLASKMKW